MDRHIEQQPAAHFQTGIFKVRLPGVARDGFECKQSSDLPLANLVMRIPVGAIEAALEAELEENPVIGDSAGSHERLLTRQRKRFLAKDVNSPGRRLLDQDGMTRRRRRDHQGPRSFLIEHQREVNATDDPSGSSSQS